MAKKLLVAVLALVLVTAVAFAESNKTIEQKPIVVKKVINLPGTAMLDGVAADPVIWSDDFEGENPMWIPDANWSYTDAPNGGRVYCPETSWRYVDTDAHSATHSWVASTDINCELDFLVSPVIDLPSELVDDQGNTMDLKGLKLNYWLKGDVTDNTWHHILGPAEVVWVYDTTNPGEGTSAWWCDMPALSSDAQWRQWLITPEIDLTNSNGTLAFKHAYNTELEFDFIGVEISEDDFLTYTTLGFWGDGFSDGSGFSVEGWNDITLDISPWTGKTVKIRWSSKGDYGTAGQGWWVDAIDVGGVFADDGGDTEETEMTVAGFTSGAINNGYFGGDYTIGGAVDWVLASDGYADFPLEVDGWATNFGPGEPVRFALKWMSDGLHPGQNLYIDDFELLGVGKQAVDLAVIGADLRTAALCHEFHPRVFFANLGLNTLTGNLTWTGKIVDAAGNSVVTVFGMANINVASDSVFALGSMGKAWIPAEAGAYTMDITLVYSGDGDPTNNELSKDFVVLGGAQSAPVWKQDFDSNPLAEDFDDFGFVVEDGGGDVLGNNINTWDYRAEDWGLGFGSGPDISAFWGTVDPGINPDTSEVLDEGLVTPPIDIAMVGKNNTLHLNAFIYHRSGYPGYDDYGVGLSVVTFEASIDGGETWVPFFEFADDDGLPGGPRIPQNVYPDMVLSMWDFLDFDLGHIVWNRHPDADQLWMRFHLYSENSYFVAMYLDELTLYMGVAAPQILKVADVPDDNGKQVQVAWKPCMPDLKIWDRAGTGWPVTKYCLWREMQVDPAAGNAKLVADEKEMLANAGNAKPGDVFVTADGMGWNFIVCVPAMEWQVYSYVAPTLWDEVETAFMVSAHTANPQIFQPSAPVAGMSTDDLAPYAPMNAVATADGHDITVVWEASYSEDVKHYTVYLNGTEVAKTTSLTYADNQLDGDYAYKVTATDYAGNESEPAEATVTVATSVDFNDAVPTEFAMYQNYPNPFNPETSIRYSVAEPTHVTIKVYNTAGQEIATLIDRQVAAGNYTANWAAKSVSSGVYFYSIKAGDFSKTMKMTLMK
ncbi:T9SS type A sorting domain-containing protein [candidate division KSB1 bacterium]|nr:T9SS type A sorting domain-containing protein [candidate division KSB1 bacterium]